MGIWEDHKWNHRKALNGFLCSLLLPTPFIWCALQWARQCPAKEVLTQWWHFKYWCSVGLDYFLLAALLLYLPMYLLTFIHGNGWVNDLYWTVVPLLALFQFSYTALRLGLINTSRASLLWTAVFLWALRLTHNYLRREEYTFGAQEDFRFQGMRTKFGHWWPLISIFVQFLLQHFIESLFIVPYFSIITDQNSLDCFDLACFSGAIICVAFAAVADDQLRAFVTNPHRKPTDVLSSGIWRYSRHPNYVAESTFHWALAIWSVRNGGAILLIGSTVNTLILIATTFMTETHMLKGLKAVAYRKYMKSTASWVLI